MSELRAQHCFRAAQRLEGAADMCNGEGLQPEATLLRAFAAKLLWRGGDLCGAEQLLLAIFDDMPNEARKDQKLTGVFDGVAIGNFSLVKTWLAQIRAEKKKAANDGK